MRVIKFSPIWGNNVGDLIISSVIEKEMAKRGIEVTSYDWMFRTKKSYRQATNIKLTTFQKTSLFLQKYVPDLFWLLKILNYLYKNDGKRYEFRMEGFDHVLIGGGNLLMDKHGIDYSFRAADIIRRAKAGVSVIGIGAGPFRRKASRNHIEALLSKCSHVWFRDEVSASCFTQIPDERKNLVPDPAFVISNYITIPERQKPKYFGLNLVGGHLTDAQMYKLVKHIVVVCERHNYGIKIINTAYPTDGISASRFFEMLPAHIRNKSYIMNLDESVNSFRDAFKDIGFFLGSRMHSVIFAASYNIPVAGISWDRKVVGVLEVIYGKSSRDFHLDSSTNDFDAEVRCVVNKLTDTNFFPTYATRIHELQKEIEDEFDILCQDLKSDAGMGLQV